MIGRYIVAGLSFALLAATASAQTFNGNSLAFRSSGASSGSDWTLNENGYVGTYVTLAAPGDLTVTAQASGLSGGGLDPHMNIVIADTKAGFDVVPGFNSYQNTFSLPAGTYFVRTEFNNDVPTADRQLTVRSLNFSGATVLNSTTQTTNDGYALAAADTYISNFRKGAAQVALVGAVPGSQVHVKLKRSAFNFGTALGGLNNTPPSSTWAAPTNDPNSDAYKLQHAIVANFNTIVPGNAGKWQQNEFNRDSLFYPVLQNIFNFAQNNNLRMRMHNLIWGQQQPTWVNAMLNNPNAMDTTAGQPQGLTNKDALRQEISERIKYYIGNVGTDWSTRYHEVDLLNEAIHQPVYMNIFGAQGIADIYNEAAAAAAAAGTNVSLFTNEYNVLQFGTDDYGNWYRQHVEDLVNAGGHVDGIGVQYYVDERTSSIGNAQHSASRITQTLQNLSVTGLDSALTEFGVNHAASETLAARFLDESVRLIYGNASSTGFTMFGFWAPDTYKDGAAFYSSTWAPRPPLATWQNLMSQWSTDLTLPVNPDGTIDFTGFYGDYDLTIGAQTYHLSLTKGDPLYSVVVAAGDYNADGIVNAADYTLWRDTLGSTIDLRADGNGDGSIDAGDYDIWTSKFGTSYAGGAAAAVPEPSSLVLLGIGVLAWAVFFGRSAGSSRCWRVVEPRC